MSVLSPYSRLARNDGDVLEWFNPLAPEQKAELVRQASAEREYLTHARDLTGEDMSGPANDKQTLERRLVLEQSHKLAQTLEAAGKAAYRDDSAGLWVYWVHSDTWEGMPDFRRICLLPYIAAMVRASKMSALEYWLSRNQFARFWTFTAGERCTLDNLRERCKYLHRKLSKLNAYLRKKYGVEMVFRSTEFGTLECDKYGNRRKGAAVGGDVEFRDDGEPLFHPHAHVVVHSLVGYIPEAKWSAMIKDVHGRWEHHWDAGKMIRNARECCKYVTKPGDMLKLTGEQLGRLHEAVFRMKLCQPMGELKAEIRARKVAKETLRRYPAPNGDGTIWRVVKDQNKHVEQSPEEIAAANDIADAEVFAAELAAAMRVKVTAPTAIESIEQTWTFSDGVCVRETVKQSAAFVGTPFRAPDTEKDWCRVFSRLSPAVGPRGLKEPRVIVGGSRFDRSAVRNHALVARLWAETVEAWEMGLSAARISVHTGTPTVSASRSSSQDTNSRSPIFDPPECPEHAFA